MSPSRVAGFAAKGFYCARPPFALERVELMKDGRVTYRLKTPRRGKTHRVMTPVEFLARLTILVPPPYFPLVRYHAKNDADLSRELSPTGATNHRRPGSLRRHLHPDPCESRVARGLLWARAPRRSMGEAPQTKVKS